MHAENFLVNHGSNRKTIEHIAEYAPKSDRESTFALVIEAVDSVDLSTLVVSSKQEEVLRVLDFVAKEETDCFNGLFSTIDVVSQEEVIGLRGEATILEDAKQVVVLSMDITYKMKVTSH